MNSEAKITYTLYNTNSDRIAVDKVLTTVASGEGVVHPPFDVLNPNVILKSSAIPKFNYMYIQETDRFYFAGPPQWLGGDAWSVSLQSDVLGTWKTNIKNLNAYVSRCESEYDLGISDNAAPSLVGLRRNVVRLAPDTFTGADSPWTSSGSVLVQQGEVVVVALNVSAYQTQNSTGWVVPDTPYLYVCLSFSEYSKLINVTKRIGADFVAGLTGISDFSNIIADAYVLPYEPNHGAKVTNIGIWETQSPIDINSWDGIKDWAIPANCYVLEKNSLGEFYWSADITLPSSDTYKNASPFASYTVETYPLGCQDIDSRILAQAGPRCRLYIGCVCDPLGGDAIYHFGVGEYEVSKTIGQLRSLCVYPLGSTNIKTDYATVNVTNSNIKITELASKLVGAGESMVSAAMGGSYVGALAGGVKEAAGWDFGVPSYSVAGTPKGALFTNGVNLIMTYQEQLPIPETLIGRPLFQIRRLGDLSGFVQVQDVHVEGFPCFAEEQQEIETLLKSGVIL